MRYLMKLETTIKVSTDTKAQLKAWKNRNETFNDYIKRLMSQ